MSNNPGFGDYNNARRSPSLFAANIISNSGNPREENFWKFLTNFFCPFFRFKSFISLITLIDIIMYIVTLTYDGIDDVDNGLLAPTFKALDMFGMSNYIKIKNGQVWRLATAAMLHANLVHLTMNMLSQIIIGTYLEHHLGAIKTFIFYFASSIGGEIFTLVINKGNGVGASIAIFGMLGGYIGLLIINWNYTERTQGPLNNYFNILFALLLILFNFSVGISGKNIDNYGHLGGLFAGFFLVFLFAQPSNINDYCCFSLKIWWVLSISYLALNYVLGLCVIYFVYE